MPLEEPSWPAIRGTRPQAADLVAVVQLQTFVQTVEHFFLASDFDLPANRPGRTKQDKYRPGPCGPEQDCRKLNG